MRRNAGAEHWSRELELKQGEGGVYAGAKVGEEAVYAAATDGSSAQHEMWGLAA